MTHRILIFLLLFISCITSVSAYTFELSDDNIVEGQTLIAEITTTLNPERNDPYTLIWYKSDGTILETDTGLMSDTIGGVVFETYESFQGDNTVNGNISYDLNNDGVDETEFFNISISDIDLLRINNVKFAPIAKIGSNFALDVEITQNNKTVNNAECLIYGTDINEAPIQVCTESGAHSKSFAGRTICNNMLDLLFKENQEYLAKVKCNCRTGDFACFNSNGTIIENTYGENTFVFEVIPWLSVNTIIDETMYEVDDTIYVCANVTNLNNERLSIAIEYNWRCQNGGGAASTDRILLGDKTEIRGISPNTTQNQCNSFLIADDVTMEKGAINCYGATSVTVLDRNKIPVYSYDTTSDSFIINVTEINPLIRWKKIEERTYTAKINIDDYDVDIKNIDVRINERISKDMTNGEELDSYTVTYYNGSAIPYETEIQIIRTAITDNDVDRLDINKFNEFTITILNVNTTLDERFLVTINIKEEIEDDRMLSIILAMSLIAIFYGMFGYINMKLSGLNRDSKSYWLMWFCFCMVIIEVVMGLSMVYGNYIGSDLTILLRINFIANLLSSLGILLGTIALSYIHLGSFIIEDNKASGKKWKQ